MRARKLSTVALGVGVLTLSLRPAAAEASSGIPTARAALACKDVLFVGARGSGQKADKKTHGLGPELYYMATRLKGELAADGDTMGMLGAVYDADPVEELVPSKAELAGELAGALIGAGGPTTAATAFGYYRGHLRPYMKSVNEGRDDIVEIVRTESSTCPDTELVLAGYSQGAIAVHQAEQMLADEGADDALDAIGGTLLLADGDRVPASSAHQVGDAPAGGEGIRVWWRMLRHPRDVEDPDTSVSICAAGDIVCDFTLSAKLQAWKRHVRTHTQYLDRKDLLNQAVDWLNDEI